MNEQDSRFEYVAFRDCGCIVGLASDTPTKQERQELSKTVADWIKKGFSVNRLPIDEVKDLLEKKGFGCTCENQEEKQRQLSLEI